MQFKDRHEAGKKLADKLSKYKNKKDVIILGIPRGGVEVGYDVAKKLRVPLSVVVTKKIGYPLNPEFAIGAASSEEYIVDDEYKDLEKEYLKETVNEIKKEIKRRYNIYTKGKIPELKNKIVIIVDDGLATGLTMLVAIKYVKSKKPKKVIVATPVAARESFQKAKKQADEIVCLHVPMFFGAVGSFYEEFAQLEDMKVKNYLEATNCQYQ